MTPPRVLIVVNHAGFFLSHRLPVALEARARGYDVHVATPRSRHVSRVEAAGLPWHAIRLARSGTAPPREARTLLDLVSLYRRLRPALVHHVTLKPMLYGTLAARVTRVPAVVNAVTGMGHVFAAGAGSPLLGRSIRTASRFVLRHPNMRVIFQNVEQRAALVSSGVVGERQTVLIRGSGVDTDVFVPRAHTAPRVPTVALICRMLATKGVAEFVRAAERLRADGVAARFLLIGEPDPDNPASLSDAQLCAWAAAGAVEYLGRREDVAELMHEIDVVCLPTYYPEGVPKVLIEAAAAGLPIVTSDLPGCRDIAQHEENGLLVPPRDVDALVSALRRCVEDAEFRARAGRVGRARAASEFSLQTVLDATMRVYEELLA